MGRNGHNGPGLQSAEIRPSPLPFSGSCNNSDDQLAAIDLPLDLNSPALSAREIGDGNVRDMIEDVERDNKLMLGQLDRVTEDFDFDDRAQLVAISPSSSPQAFQVRTQLAEAEVFDNYSPGHTRSPIIARDSTTLESVSRTIRSYVPASISIPSVVPTPPRVSLPVSFGTMATSSSPPSRINNSLKRRNSDNSPTWDYAHGHGIAGLQLNDQVFEEDPVIPISPRSSTGRGLICYPTNDEDDRILWSGWDSLGSGSKAQRLLFLGYQRGLQVWDCTNLGSVCEIMNVSRGDDWGRVSLARVLPAPLPRNDKVFGSKRPLIGVISSTDETQLLVYSLHTHEVINRISLPNIASFHASNRFVVVSTTTPELRIFSSSTLESLYTIPSTSLASFASPNINFPPMTFNDNNDSYTSVAISSDYDDMTITAHPVFTLSGRFLAYASPPPLTDTSATAYAVTDSRSPTSTLGSSGRISVGGVIQSEIGNAAIRMGESVLSGMKALGGMAYNAAKAKARGDSSPPHAPSSPTTFKAGAGSGLSNLFSKSAPSSTGLGYEKKQSHSLPLKEKRSTGSIVPPPLTTATSMMNSVLTALPTFPSVSRSGVGQGSYVTVVDLMPLLDPSSSSPQPEKISEFLTFDKQPISRLSFSSNGTNLMVVPRDGQTCKVYSIRPTPKVLRQVVSVRAQALSNEGPKPAKPQLPGSSYAEDLRCLVKAGLHAGEELPWHLYDLKRGRTNAVIEHVDLADDGRWIAIGSRKRTVHVFAVNSYGGRADEISHTEGRVRNHFELPALSTEVSPVVRLHASKAPDSLRAPISFTFIKSTEATLPMNLLPTAAPFGAPLSSSPPISTQHSSPTSQPKPLSPTRFQRPKNFQDILCFDPLDGVLSLRRIDIDRNPQERSLQNPSNVSMIGGTSMSLPAGGVSPPARGISNQSFDLVAREKLIATWHLRRGADWAQIKQVVHDMDQTEVRLGKIDWIAQAELSTTSQLPNLRLRSIYLRHQFSFYALGEDYHALIRSYRLDVPARKIEVRKEVEASAYPTGAGESFVHGGVTSPMDIRRVPSSFDEPIASAMSASLGEYANPSLPILPMLPNGAPGLRFRNPIPIRNVAAGISDGMTEGLGRLRREIGKVRSPKLDPRTESSAWSPLEFDEEDEDFLLTRQKSDEVSRSTSRDGASILTPSSTQPDLFEDMDDDRGWSQEDRQAIEEAERFYDIPAVGLLDEEQEAPQAQVARGKKGKRGKKR